MHRRFVDFDHRHGAAAVWVALLAVLPLAAAPTTATDRVKVYVVEAGVYRLTHDDLVDAGLDLSEVDTSKIGLSCLGEPVPLWVEDGGDGRLDRGDALVFVGTHLAGSRSHFNEYSPLNVFLLELDVAGAARMAVTPAPETCGEERVQLVSSRHLEQDLLRVRFPSRDDERNEVWFWAKLTQIDPKPFVQSLQLDDLDPGAERSVRLRIRARGWSRLPAALAALAEDHRLEVRLNGRPIGAGEWDNRDGGYELVLEHLSPSLFRVGANELELRVPKRSIGEDGRPQVDVVLVNSIEIDYPRTSRVTGDQAMIASLGSEADACTELTTSSRQVPVVFATAGRRIEGRSASAWGWGDSKYLFPGAAADSGPYHVVVGDGYRSPLAIEPDRPSDLRSPRRRADYIIIVHPRLRQAIEPLAEFHRGRGLVVDVVDIVDVYDEFTYGIAHPRAIRDFLTFAHGNWAGPSPRFVLLVGDASWDTRNPVARDSNYVDWTFQADHRTEFGKNESTPYAKNAGLNHRNLIPTWSYPTREGHAATDNWFADVEGDDGRPDLAIGRLPVTEPEEVRAIVDKSVAYASSNPVGPWRRRVLWITNEQEGSRRRSDFLAASLESRGFSSRKVYPVEGEPSNEHHRESLRSAFDEGQLLVHFFGHGGRYIWRTGPPDLKKNHDLFTLEDLDLLQPNDRLPIVLSMTCYSAPFDHPNADSIGEKFLRLKGRGAVAVIAAAWRNSPTQRMSELLLQEMTHPGTVGEALMRAKRSSRHVDFRQQYNLLGDPALPVALPTLPLSLSTVDAAPPKLRGRVAGRPFAGRALVEWLAEDGSVLAEAEQAVSHGSFEASYAGVPARAAQVRAVRVYVWDEASAQDGIGFVRVGAAATAANVAEQTEVVE